MSVAMRIAVALLAFMASMVSGIAVGVSGEQGTVAILGGAVGGAALSILVFSD